MSSILTRFGLLRTDEVAHRALGHVHGHRQAGELVVREQAVQRAVEVAAVVRDGSRDEAEHVAGHIEARVMRARGRDAALQDFEPQLFLQRSHLDHEPAGKARAHAVVEAFEVARRPVGRDHHLAAGIDQRVERVAELDLRRLALQELQVVDHQHVDAAQRFLEGERGLRFERGDEAVHELLGRQIQHLAVGHAVAGPGERLQQVRLAEPDARMDVERIEHHRHRRAARSRPVSPPHARACWSGRPRRCRTPAADRAASRRAPRARPARGTARRARHRARPCRS